MSYKHHPLSQFLPVGVLPRQAPDRGCYVSGLQLHHAGWDSGTSCLVDLAPPAPAPAPATPLVSEEPCPQPVPVIWLKPLLTTELDAIRASQGAALYPCPVYPTPQHRTGTGSGSVVMVTVEVPTVARTPGYWSMQRVYMTTSLTQHDLHMAGIH